MLPHSPLYKANTPIYSPHYRPTAHWQIARFTGLPVLPNPTIITLLGLFVYRYLMVDRTHTCWLSIIWEISDDHTIDWANTGHKLSEFKVIIYKFEGPDCDIICFIFTCINCITAEQLYHARQQPKQRILKIFPTDVWHWTKLSLFWQTRERFAPKWRHTTRTAVKLFKTINLSWLDALVWALSQRHSMI